ncbi:YfiR family protein [Emcibacter sp. SYSU 3D8]|uniref:YfiR family protein n=1 Tax=Emcibacter sp. SYSU 3D8 TaxID=3133969 RepID=UPI0031FE58D7
MEDLIRIRRLSWFCARAVLALGVMLAGGPGAASAAADNPVEAAVKAAYLYKFGAFVRWPDSAFESPSAAVNVCIAGTDPFGDKLDKAVSGQRIGDRPIVVRRLKTVDPGSGCQILYVGGPDDKEVAAALSAVRGAAVLTVTDDGRGGAAGILQFVIKDNRVRFSIDDQKAAEHGLELSSRLLQLAVSVKPRA